MRLTARKTTSARIALRAVVALCAVGLGAFLLAPSSPPVEASSFDILAEELMGPAPTEPVEQLRAIRDAAPANQRDAYDGVHVTRAGYLRAATETVECIRDRLPEAVVSEPRLHNGVADWSVRLRVRVGADEAPNPGDFAEAQRTCAEENFAAVSQSWRLQAQPSGAGWYQQRDALLDCLHVSGESDRNDVATALIADWGGQAGDRCVDQHSGVVDVLLLQN